MSPQGYLTEAKMPLDAKIVVFLMVISAIMHFLTFILLLVGAAHHPLDYQHHVFFGLFHIGSDVAASTYSLLKSMACLGGAYGLAKRYKLGWWFVLVFTAYNTADSFLLFNDYPASASIAICFGLMIIIWLIWRKKLYHIGKK